MKAAPKGGRAGSWRWQEGREEAGGGIPRCLATRFTLRGIAGNFCNRKTICVNLGGKEKKKNNNKTQEPVSRLEAGGESDASEGPHDGARRQGRRSGLGAKPARAHHGAQQRPSAPPPVCISTPLGPREASPDPEVIADLVTAEEPAKYFFRFNGRKN